jgi:alkylation response protein AidB-like acyl-CoA dehydrogenase
MILLVTREIIAKNAPSAYEVLSYVETAGHSSTTGPHIRFTEFRVPGHNLLAEPGKGAAVVLQCFTATAALVGTYSRGTSNSLCTYEIAFSIDYVFFIT